MKQHVTISQLDELSEKGKEKLRKWWRPQIGDRCYALDSFSVFSHFRSDGEEDYNEYSTINQEFILSPTEENNFTYMEDIKENMDKVVPLLSIGQMIEFLDEEKVDIRISGVGSEWRVYAGCCVDNRVEGYDDGELCDALWEAVKEILSSV